MPTEFSSYQVYGVFGKSSSYFEKIITYLVQKLNTRSDDMYKNKNRWHINFKPKSGLGKSAELNFSASIVYSDDIIEINPARHKNIRHKKMVMQLLKKLIHFGLWLNCKFPQTDLLLQTNIQTSIPKKVMLLLQQLI